MDIVTKLRFWAFKFCGKGIQEDKASDVMLEAADKIKRLKSVLQECHEFIESYADVVDGDDGQPEPNEAMSLLGLINDALGGES